MEYFIYFILAIVLLPPLIDFLKNLLSDTPNSLGDYGNPPNGDEFDRFDF